MLEINNFKKEYADKVIFENLNLTFGIGKTVIIGENGSGKTTLLNHIYELYKNDVSYFSQNLDLIPELTIIENIVFLIGFQINNDLLLLFELTDKLYRPASELSSGERQRVILYCTILCPSNIIIVDEPEKHLDKANIQKYFSLINKSEKNYIITTHEKELAKVSFDNVLEIQNHNIKQTNNKPLVKVEQGSDWLLLGNKPGKFLKTFFLIDKFYIMFFFLLVTAVFTIFANIKWNDITIAQYENDYDTTEVRIDVRTENSIPIKANFAVPEYLNSETYDFISIDLLGIFDSKDGFFVNDKKNDDIYIYKSGLTIDALFDIEDFGVYVSSNIYNGESTNFSLRISERKIRIGSNTYVFSFDENLPIKGIVENEYGRIYYDYNELYNHINSLMISEIGALDHARDDSVAFDDIFIKQRYVALINSQIPIESIEESYVLENGLFITNYSLLNNTYFSEYKNNSTLSLILLSFSMLFALSGNVAIIMFSIYLRKNQIEKYYYATLVTKRHYLLTIKLLIGFFLLLTLFSFVFSLIYFVIII